MTLPELENLVRGLEQQLMLLPDNAGQGADPIIEGFGVDASPDESPVYGFGAGDNILHRFRPSINSDDNSKCDISEGSWTRNNVKVTNSATAIGSSAYLYIVAELDDEDVPTTLTISAYATPPIPNQKNSRRLIAKLMPDIDGSISGILRCQLGDIVEGENRHGTYAGDMLVWDDSEKAYNVKTRLDDNALMTFDPAQTQEAKVAWMAHGTVGQVLTSQSSVFAWDYAMEVDGSEDGTFYIVSDIQYDGTSHKLQKQVTTVVVTDGIAAVSVDATWVDITTAAECPT